MALAFVFTNKNLDKQWRDQMRKMVTAMARATTLGARQASKDIENEGRANIKGAGKFGQRWRKGLVATTYPTSGVLINARIDVTHDQIGAGLFEHGGVVRGKPLLWLPLTYARLKGVRARDYARTQGGLFRVNRRGRAPLLLSIKDKKPKYVGLKSVRIPQKWTIRQICLNILKNWKSYYDRNLRV
jgi:hypothetical protein